MERRYFLRLVGCVAGAVVTAPLLPLAPDPFMAWFDSAKWTPPATDARTGISIRFIQQWYADSGRFVSRYDALIAMPDQGEPLVQTVAV
jgi:hypothetical protein